MPRPPKFRTIQEGPSVNYFKPRGVPARLLETVVLGLDELEAIRLADLEGLYHEEAAARMNISRPTFGRLVAQARKKVADALFHGKALVFEGGAISLGSAVWFECGRCGRRWNNSGETVRPRACGECGSDRVRGVAAEAGPPGCCGRGCSGRGRGGRRRGGRN
jgi:predicted DNA-binding protein (UPF0251 family)